MKFYKLLFFLFAFFGFHSCAEYVGNGEDSGSGDDTPDTPQFVARLVQSDAKYVGDTFEFIATLNGVNVTETTKFRVNGTDIDGFTYIPFKADEHSVIATKDNYTANFKFNVSAQGAQGNRIEYDGSSYPISKTSWFLNGKISQNGYEFPDITMPDGVTPALNWLMYNHNGNSNNLEDIENSDHIFYTSILVPYDGSDLTYDDLIFPDIAEDIVIMEGEVVINRTTVLSIDNVQYSFAPSGNTPNYVNYTGVATGTNSPNAYLYWDGNFSFTLKSFPSN